MSKTFLKRVSENFFKNSDGHIVIMQWPNIPLWGWIIFKLLTFLFKGRLKIGFETLSTASLFVWSYLEATKGVNYFRKVLGILVLFAIALSFFK